MKNFLLALAILITVTAVAQTKKVVTYHDPYTKQHVKEKYSVSTAPPYLKEGLYEEFAGDGNLIRSTTYKAGQKNGPEVIYVNVVYWCGGKPVEQNNWKNGNLDGLQKKYGCHDSNSGVTVYSGLEEESFFKNGAVQWTKTYYPNGKQKSYLVPDGLCTEWYDTGVKAAEYTFKGGQLVGAVKNFDEKGNLRTELVLYYEGSGKLKERCALKDGKKNGKDTIWFESGKVKQVSDFRNDSLLEGMLWNENGGKDFHVRFEKGVKVETTEWYEDGKMKTHGVNNGTCTTWYNNGQKEKEYEAKDWKINGAITQWRKDGTVSSSGTMENGEWKVYREHDATGKVIKEETY